MPYCNTKAQEKARYKAVQEVLSGRSKAEVARRYGCERSTISRWLARYQKLMEERLLNRKSKAIPTESSRPHHSPNKLDIALEYYIIELRIGLNRCAEVIWKTLIDEELSISLSTVRRVIARNGLIKEKSRWARYRTFSKRPLVNHPGALVEVDTVHFVHPITKTRRYATSVIDVYSRMAYVQISNKMNQANAVRAVLNARSYFEFAIETIQTDNGSEFGKYFQDEIMRRGMKYRHTRVRRPNDNAHVERFNRTLREECLGNYLPEKEAIQETQYRVSEWLDYYNNRRLHLGLQLMTPQAIVAKVVR